MITKDKYASTITSWALELGFEQIGFSQAGFLEEEAPRLEKWLNENRNGKMGYMENHFDKRLDPTLLVPGAKSVISLTYNYFPSAQQNPDSPKISKYAFGEDYHFVIKRKLKSLYDRINEEIGEVHGRFFVDSAPVLDKAWAAKSGIGWIGKNSNLINKHRGSFFFSAELNNDLDIQPTGGATDHCGTCTACIDACPTGAIIQPYVVDGSKCISYFTIELKDGIPQEFKGKMDDWMFGCDVCQDVCPWNSKSKPHQEEAFMPKPDLINMTKAQWLDLTQEQFSKVFKGSAVKRTGYKGLMRNLRFLD
ncbi:MAG: tRNA epoxyqueuosine(34) reductase QueG [Flavobacteriales bacterium]|nr:tRNA epoxyqueuosine(34) reductase QueG [Flavobacteriales bacterium]